MQNTDHRVSVYRMHQQKTSHSHEDNGILFLVTCIRSDSYSFRCKSVNRGPDGAQLTLHRPFESSLLKLTVDEF